MTSESQATKNEFTQWAEHNEPDSPVSSPLVTGGANAAIAMVGMTTLGLTANKALADDLVKLRRPRGFSINKLNKRLQKNVSVLAADGPGTAKEAARFLAQATMGTKKTDIGKMQAFGSYANWITDQFNLPYPTLAFPSLFAQKFNVEKYRDDPSPAYQTNWRLMIVSSSQLRQRIVFALSNIFVINANNLNIFWPAFAAANFIDILQLNAFGNFRALLEKVTLSSAMGAYLNMRGNYKEDPSRHTQPDENYARELLQLFTIGLYELNQDGTPILSNGNPVETYTQKDISGLARVMTGWDSDNSTPETHRFPMKHFPDRHELREKSFLGLTIPAGTNGPASLTMALDYIFNHPNVPPFLALGLIKRLVTSNPSSAYVSRVSTAFINNGAGVRGDMKAVINAVLLDAEARNPPSDNYTGKQREETLRFTAWARALQVRSPDQMWSFNFVLNQFPYQSPTVFNFFKPSYTPPQSQLANQGLVAPEFQLTNETSVFRYIDTVQSLGYGGIVPNVANYTSLLSLARDSKTLLDEVNLIIAAGQVSDDWITKFATAIDPMSTSDLYGKLDKIKAAITLIMTSPEFIVVK